MRRVKALVLLGITSFPLHSAEEPGTYLFLYSQLFGCGETTYVVDYAEVPESGMITLLGWIEISILGLPEEEIEKVLAEQVGELIGHTPKTLSVELIPATDSKRIAEKLVELLSAAPGCARSLEPPPPPDLKFIRSLAHIPSDKTLYRPPDDSVNVFCHAACSGNPRARFWRS
jgi:hypothetical protein